MEEVLKRMDMVNRHAAQLFIGESHIEVLPMAWSDNVFLYGNSEMGILEQVSLFADVV